MQPVRRVGLIGEQHLLREGIEALLNRLKDVQVCGLWEATPAALAAIEESHPDVVLMVASGSHNQETVDLIASILDRFPHLPVVRVTLQEGTFQVYQSYLSPAHSDALAAILSGSALTGWTEAPSSIQSKKSGGKTHAQI